MFQTTPFLFSDDVFEDEELIPLIQSISSSIVSINSSEVRRKKIKNQSILWMRHYANLFNISILITNRTYSSDEGD